MLGKLMKHEIYATQHVFLPMFGGVLLMALVSRLLFALSSMTGGSISFTFLSGISAFLYGMLLFALFVVVLVITIQRFYKNLLGDEGYLMFTLPVKPWQHIMAKLIVSALWLILSTVAMALSILLLASTGDFFRTLAEGLPQIFGAFGKGMPDSLFYAVECIFLMLASIALYNLILYLAIAIGHLAQRHRLLCAFGAFIGINLVLQILFTTFLVGADALGMFSWMNTVSTTAAGHIGLIGLFLSIVMIDVILFALTNLILNRKLNLE